MGLDLLKLLVLIYNLVLNIPAVSCKVWGILEVRVVVGNFGTTSVIVSEIFDQIHARQNLTTVGWYLEGTVTLSLLLSLVVENASESAYKLLEPGNDV